MLIVLIVLIILFGGGGGYYYGRGRDWGAPHYGGGLLGLAVIIVLVLIVTGHFGTGLIR